MRILYPIILLTAFFLAGCQTSQTQSKPGFGGIHGTVTARSHKDVIAKAIDDTSETRTDAYGNEATRGGELVYAKSMINYRKLDEIFVGVIGANPKHGTVHNVEAGHNGFRPHSLALATGDVLHITNTTSHSLTIFLAGTTSDSFDELPVLASGASGDLTVASAGNFELGADEDDHMAAMILARPKMAVKRVPSGKEYEFKDLEPGDYHMIFWYWRLGAMERSVTVKADETVQEDETLAVDRLVR
ncbi:MAG: hypothetical protein HQ503_08430 [Rhodospirillales bacterium]|nr:hypothetical protein [Rhodospirillales bacterium]